eukprot:351058-Chlamydomonas_euryale.AAC.5
MGQSVTAAAAARLPGDSLRHRTTEPPTCLRQLRGSWRCDVWHTKPGCKANLRQCRRPATVLSHKADAVVQGSAKVGRCSD